MRYLLVVLILLSIPAAAQQRDCGKLPDILDGQVYAIDGATLAMIAGDKRTPDIRLWGIRAPVLRDRMTGLENPAGMQARERLDRILRTGRSAFCRPKAWDSECRVVADCQTVASHNTDLGMSMVAGGFAYVDVSIALRGDITYGQNLLKTERDARSERRGLWRLWDIPQEK